MISVDLSNDIEWGDVGSKLPRAYSLNLADFGLVLAVCRARVFGSRLASETTRVVGASERERLPVCTLLLHVSDFSCSGCSALTLHRRGQRFQTSVLATLPASTGHG